MREDLEAAVAAFTAVRPRLFGVAYRMLGSAAEAEDVLQNAWVRWQACDRREIESPAGFLMTMVTRLSINEVGSARMRHEAYVGPWLPEPVDTAADPTLGAERAEALGFAVLLLLEKLTATERAAYVLREAFDYPYPLIAEVIQVTESSARQLVSRAKRHLSEPRSRAVEPPRQRQLLEAFVHAAQTGDLQGLERLLAADVVSYSDGGGVAKLAARIPVIGRERVAKFVAAFSGHFWVGCELRWVEANGAPAVVVARDDEAYAVLALTASEGGIDQLLWTMNPSKYAGIAASSSR